MTEIASLYLSIRLSPPSRPAFIATPSKAQPTLRSVRLENFWTLRMRKRHVLFILPFLNAACVTNGTRALVQFERVIFVVFSAEDEAVYL